jgi:hypothetical protein
MHIAMIAIFLLQFVAVNSYIIADTSMFGNCFLHIKRFRDSSTTADITSIFIRARIGTRSHSIVSIFSANETRSIKPEGRTKEACSLNIIIGFVRSKAKLLYRFMYTNPYTYLSRPNLIYVLVVDSLQRLSVPKSSITLPTSIFVLQFPPFYLNNHIALHSSPSYFYLCLSCHVFLQPVTNNKRIRFLSEYSYQKEWKKPYLTMQIIVRYRTKKISWCEQNIWKKWLAPKGDARRTFWSQCNKPAAFWDLLLRSVHPNFTIYLQPKVQLSKKGFTGSFLQKFYGNGIHPNSWQISSSYYAGSAIPGIIYCDCKRRAKSVSLEIWNVGFGKLEWAFIIGTSAIVSNYCNSMGKGSTNSYVGEFINVVGIILRQGSKGGYLLALFSLGMFSVSLLFENAVTSSLVAPKKNDQLDLVQLVHAGYHIIVTGSTHEFGSNLPHLQYELNKLNIQMNLRRIETRFPEMNNPRELVESKCSYFFISTLKGKDFIQQSIKSKVPEHCVCPQITNEFSQFPVYSFFSHKLTFKIFINVQLLTEAGLHNFFDWNLQRLEPDFSSKSKSIAYADASFDSYISLKNLYPLLLISGFLILLSCLTFSLELGNLAYKKYVVFQLEGKVN